MENGRKDGACSIGAGGVVGDEVREEEGRETEGGVDEGDAQRRGAKITVREEEGGEGRG